MSEKLSVYILGDLKEGAADGLAEFNYQNVQLLKNDFNFQFIELDATQNKDFYQTETRYTISIHRFGGKNLRFLELPKNLEKLIRGLPKHSTIFHLHHIFNTTNYLVSKALNRSGITYLITPHDSFVYCPSYGREKPLIKRLYRKTFNHIFDKYVLDHAKVVHALTEQCPPCLKHITNSPIEVVLNQVRDMQLKFDIQSIKNQVCFIGRFDVLRKGIDLALYGFNLFIKSNKTAGDASFVLVGPADKQASDKVHQICKDLDLEVGKEVIFTGKISESDRNRILTESKVYMQLSRTEGFGLSIAQALSCYKPVIISKQIPIHDKILDYKAGIVVNNPQQTSEALYKIFALSPSEYIEMANNARHCYEHEFHPTVIKPQLMKLYNGVANK